MVGIEVEVAPSRGKSVVLMRSKILLVLSKKQKSDCRLLPKDAEHTRKIDFQRGPMLLHALMIKTRKLLCFIWIQMCLVLLGSFSWAETNPALERVLDTYSSLLTLVSEPPKENKSDDSIKAPLLDSSNDSKGFSDRAFPEAKLYISSESSEFSRTDPFFEKRQKFRSNLLNMNEGQRKDAILYSQTLLDLIIKRINPSFQKTNFQGFQNNSQAQGTTNDEKGNPSISAASSLTFSLHSDFSVHSSLESPEELPDPDDRTISEAKKDISLVSRAQSKNQRSLSSGRGICGDLFNFWCKWQCTTFAGGVGAEVFGFSWLCTVPDEYSCPAGQAWVSNHNTHAQLCITGVGDFQNITSASLAQPYSSDCIAAQIGTGAFVFGAPILAVLGKLTHQFVTEKLADREWKRQIQYLEKKSGLPDIVSLINDSRQVVNH